MKETRMDQDMGRSKVPKVTFIFWIIKILATTLEGGILSSSPGPSKNGVKINIFRTT
jgi:hypothetical protein